MEKNVGGYERIARVALGGALLVLGRRFRRAPGAGTIRRLAGRGMAMFGLNLLGTAVSQRCPANTVLGRNTYAESSDSIVDRSTEAVTERSPSSVQ